MDALFIVPTLVSPQVNEKMIPALAKMIERNIILNNSALFQKAAIEKNSRYTSWSKVKNESSFPVTIISDGIISESSSLAQSFINQALNEAKASTYYDSDEWSTDLDAITKRRENAETFVKYTKDLRAKNEKLKEIDRLRRDELTLRANALKAQTDAARSLSDAEKLIKDREDKAADRSARSAESEARLQIEREKIERDIKEKEKLLHKPLTSEEKRKTLMDIESLRNMKLNYKRVDYDFKKTKQTDRKARSAELSGYRDNAHVKPEDVEMPSGIQFFRQISLEPTILNIKIATGTVNGEGMVIKVGVKCIPYILDDVSSIVDLLTEAKNMGVIERLFKNAIRSVNTKIWFTKRRSINKGKFIDPNEATEAIKYTPNAKELVKYINLAKSFNSMDSASWSTMIVLSSNDIDNNEELMELVNNYRKLTKYVFGDIIITNETKESAFFCTPKFGSCQEIPYSYLAKVLNLSDVIDYADASRASAWSKETNNKNSNIKKAISESAYIELRSKLTNILRTR